MGVWKLAFLTFFGTLASISRKLVVRLSPNFYNWQTTISALMSQEKSKIVSSEVSQKCEKPRNLGFGAVWGCPPYGAHTPDLTNPSYSPMGPEKNTFYSGAIGPHLGEIWNFEFFNITVFEPSLAESCYCAVDGVERCGWCAVSTYRPAVQWSSVCGARPRLRTRRV